MLHCSNFLKLMPAIHSKLLGTPSFNVKLTLQSLFFLTIPVSYGWEDSLIN